MDKAALSRVMADPTLKTLIQAAVRVASYDGYTVRELAEIFGVGKSTIHRWVVKRRDKAWKDPRAIVLSAPVAASGCGHTSTVSLGPGLRICLDCRRVTPELSRILGRDRRPTPKPDPKPRTKYRPGKYKGGIG